MQTVLEFHVQPDDESGYSVSIYERGKTDKLAGTTFEYDTSYIGAHQLRQLDIDKKNPQGRFERLTQFGRQLYDRLFTPEISKIWEEYKSKSDFLVLCLRIDREAAALETLPWETLFDGNEHIAAGKNTGLSRLPLDVRVRNNLPARPTPLKVFALVSCPLDLAEHKHIAVEDEQEILLQAVNAPSGQGKLVVDFEDEAKLSIIENSLEGGYDVLHYFGHGISPEGGGGLLLEDDSGNSKPVKSEDFVKLLPNVERNLRLAVIVGCQTCQTADVAGFKDLARMLVERGIPAVVAMQFSISMDAGLVFSEQLYPLLMDGRTVEQAVSKARHALLQKESS